MEQPWRLAAAATMIAAMAGGIVWFGLSDGDDGRTVPTSRAAAAVPPTTVPPAEESSDPVLAATKGALAAWGELAVTGDLAVVDGWFVADGEFLGSRGREEHLQRFDGVRGHVPSRDCGSDGGHRTRIAMRC